MPHYLNNDDEFYEWLVNIHKLEFQKKSVLILGSGKIADQYAFALNKMKINDITVISRTGSENRNIRRSSGIKILSGGFEKHLPNLEKKDLVIVALPTEMLLPAAEMALKYGQTNILVEKPGSLYSKDLRSFEKIVKSQKIRIAYNRLLYPNFHKLKQLILKDGGISSIKFTFTEWIDNINFPSYARETLQHWGIQNSLHVISMVIDLIGDLKQISAYQFGKLEWHPSGSCFVGWGLSENNIPFSYHADWQSGDRWSIEIFTKQNSYKLVPLEDLFICPKGSTNFKKIEFETAFPEVKQGISEEIAIMLTENDDKLPFVTLSKAAKFNDIANKIFGYKFK